MFKKILQVSLLVSIFGLSAIQISCKSKSESKVSALQKKAEPVVKEILLANYSLASNTEKFIYIGNVKQKVPVPLSPIEITDELSNAFTARLVSSNQQTSKQKFEQLVQGGKSSELEMYIVQEFSTHTNIIETIMYNMVMAQKHAGKEASYPKMPLKLVEPEAIF